MPEISVIIPVYNVQNSLKKCIDSVLTQTYKDYEILLVNDGATDNSGAICDKYADQYSFINVIHKQNGGLSSARLAGYKSAHGKYICFIDSDDYLEKDYLEILYSAISVQNADIAVCSFYTENSHNMQVMKLPYTSAIYNTQETINNEFVYPLFGKSIQGQKAPCFVWNKLYKREMINTDFFYSERTYYMEDHLFNLRYMESVNTVAVVNRPLYHYVLNMKSLTNTYRQNKWFMYSNLFSFMEDYSQNNLNHSEVMNYLYSISRRWLFDSLDNASKQNDYKAFKKEVKSIISSDLTKIILKHNSFAEFLNTEKISYILVIFHLYYPLYRFRKWRQKIAYTKSE